MVGHHVFQRRLVEVFIFGILDSRISIALFEADDPEQHEMLQDIHRAAEIARRKEVAIKMTAKNQPRPQGRSSGGYQSKRKYCAKCKRHAGHSTSEHRPRSGASKRPRDDSGNKHCTACHGNNHEVSECRFARAKASDTACNKCGAWTHTSDQCKMTRVLDKSGVRCTYCGKYGHSPDKCYTKQRHAKRSGNQNAKKSTSVMLTATSC